MNTNTLQIIPAILTKDFKEIENKAHLVAKLVPVVQIDICDGKFTPESTWPYVKKTLPVFADDFEMPSWEFLDFELDLMIQNPEDTIENLKNLGCTRAILHLGSTTEEGLQKAAILLDAYDIEVGLAITNDCDFDILDKTVKTIDTSGVAIYIQVMGITQPGKQGQPFDNRTLVTLQKLHTKYPDIILQVDGSVSDKTISDLYQAGATRLVIGSWLYQNEYVIEDKLQLAKNLI